MSLMVAINRGGFKISYELRLKPPLVAMFIVKIKENIFKNQV